jgi:Tfp pilus assembly protein PilN
MINLIPNQEKKKMMRGFYYRLATLFLAMLVVCSLVAIVAILPSYFFSISKNNIAQEKLRIQKREVMPSFDQETLAVIKDLNNKLALVEKAEQNKFNVSEKVINAVILKKIDSVKITEISYSNDVDKGKSISLQGTAPSREILLLFRRALEDDPLFKNVNLPISNFVKGSNIQFYLTLTPS